jgi:hypothetical protein
MFGENDMKKRLLLSVLFLLLAAVSAPAEKTDDTRLDEVERRGEQVMPFYLEQTTHIFNKTGKGGLQQVIAKESADKGQIELIRAHLFKISRDFMQGDFSDPMKIHGEDMPGLEDLRKAAPGSIRIEYRDLPTGAQIGYTTDDPRLVEAIHRWFDAQLSDHSGHAVPGGDNHPQHSP